MSAKNVQIARFRSRADSSSDPSPHAGTACIGHVVSILEDGRVGVAVPGIAATLEARLAVQLTHARLRQAIESRQSAVIIFEANSAQRAIVIGLIEAVPLEAPAAAPPEQAPADHPEAPRVVEADVDGKRVRIVGSDEIVLECGNASITLRRNGRVIIRGTYVETDSAGTNRIKGAAVRIN
jgi:hypothetical protein